MKKLIPATAALAAVLCAGFVFLWHKEPYRARAAEIAPPEAILFAQLPDIRRTVERWPATAMARLWSDPEMRAFFAQPLAKMPALRRAQEHAARLRRIAPREAFVAIVAFDGPAPKFVAGLNFSGSQSEVAAFVAEPWAAARKAWPAGRAGLLHRPEWKIETYAFEDQLLAGSFHAGWYFLANDLLALDQTLARCKAGPGSGIGSTPALRRAAAPLPAELDAFVFAQPGRILERLGKILASTAEAPAAANASETHGPMAWGVKLEGAQIRDTIFVAGAPGAEIPLARSTLTLTSPETLLYGAFVLPKRIHLPSSTAPLLTLLTDAPTLAMMGGLASWTDFTAAFGPECGVMLDWPAAADAPALSFVFAVRDGPKAAGFVESLTGPSAKGAPWQRQEKAGVIHYQAPRDRKTGTAPALALMREFVVLGAQAPAVRAIAARLETGGADVGQSAVFREITARVSTPTTALAYLDLRGLLERSYETLRPFLGMSLALAPETGPYFDTSRLPSTVAILRHLGPSVYSQTTKDDGIYIESLGSLSLSQTLAGFAAVAWTSGAPSFRRLGKNDAPRPLKAQPGAPIRSSKSTAKPGKAAENSKESQNVDETSHFRTSHP